MLAAAWLTVAPRHLWIDKISRGFTIQERSLLAISDSTRSPVEALWNPNLPTHPVCQLCHADSPDEHRTLKRAKFPEEVSRGGHRYLKRRRRKAGKTPISEKGQKYSAELATAKIGHDSRHLFIFPHFYRPSNIGFKSSPLKALCLKGHGNPKFATTRSFRAQFRLVLVYGRTVHDSHTAPAPERAPAGT